MITEACLLSGLVAFLASPAASYMTGQCIAVDGGFSARGMWPADGAGPFGSVSKQ